MREMTTTLVRVALIQQKLTTGLILVKKDKSIQGIVWRTMRRLNTLIPISIKQLPLI